MKEEFTLGEWKAVINAPLEDDYICDVYDSNNNCVCECFTAGNWGDETGISEQQKTANMYLIAAAPEMYRMLKQLHGALKSVPILQGEIEAVLKKVRGE